MGVRVEISEMVETDLTTVYEVDAEDDSDVFPSTADLGEVLAKLSVDGREWTLVPASDILLAVACWPGPESLFKEGKLDEDAILALDIDALNGRIEAYARQGNITDAGLAEMRRIWEEGNHGK